MKLVESIMTKNPCYNEERNITVKGLMLHSVGCAQPNAEVFIRIFNDTNYDRACVHGFIDANTGTCYQTLPWNKRGWHAGGSANDTHIGVEMCEPSYITYTGGDRFTVDNEEKARAQCKTAYDAAVQLFAYLCEKFNLDPLKSGVIISHKEGYSRGVASGHSDPHHLWEQLSMGYTMDGFRKDVKAAMNGGKTTTSATTSTTASSTSKTDDNVYRVRKSWFDAKSQIGAYRNLQSAKDLANKNKGYYVFDKNGKVVYPITTSKTSTKEFKVRISIPDLNIRKGPGTNYARTGGFTGVGVFTIVETKKGTGATKGWGKLKAGGWISMDYATKI